MKQQLTKQNLVRLAVALVFIALFALACVWANSGWTGNEITESSGVEYEIARVDDILEDNTVADESIEGRLRGNKVLTLEILTGRYAGSFVDVTNYFSAMYSVDVDLDDTLSVRIYTTGVGEFQVSVYNTFHIV